MKVKAIDIINYLYCPRYIYYEYVLGIKQFEEKYAGVIKGREIHHKKTIQNQQYLRKRIKVKRKWINLYLNAENMVGVPDEIFEFEDGTMGCLDYKFSAYNSSLDKLFKTYKNQLFAYAIMIEKTFGKPVKRCYISYVRNKKLIEISIREKDKARIKEIIANIIQIIENNIYPSATKEKSKCLRCTYRNICDEGLRQI